MTEQQAIYERHSVRSYKDIPLSEEVKKELKTLIDECNAESGLYIQLVTDEPQAFDGFMAHYGNFSGVKNYVALIGKKGPSLDEKCGYYGEKIVLKAQTLGLNTCWVAMSYKKIKTAFKINSGEKLCVVIALGYGATQGIQHKSKPVSQVVNVCGEAPDWFKKGVEAALLAPTAMNQQKFVFALDGDKVTAKAGVGFYSKVDLGICKYNFEVGSGKKVFSF